MTTAAKSPAGPGRSSPLGATVVPDGVNFSVYSRSASGLELVLFDREDDVRPGRIITIDRLQTGPIIIGMYLCKT